MELCEETDSLAWDQFVGRHEWGHPLQLWAWGEAKRDTGWVARRLRFVENGATLAAAQVLLWPIPRTGRFIAYVPRGPVVDPASKAAGHILRALIDWARQHKALYLRIEPAWRQADMLSKTAKSHRLMPEGWLRAKDSIQLAATYTIDLGKTEDGIMEPMARKHRQYIRKSERSGVAVERELRGNLSVMYEIYSQTAQRAGFSIHTEEYYRRLLDIGGGNNYLFYASYDGGEGARPVAFLWLLAAGRSAYELYGGVTAEGQDQKANYVLKWHAIKAMKADGFSLYDFNGRLNDGVSRFKEGFGADETDWIGTWDYPINPLGYRMWQKAWPVAKPIGRRILKVVRGR